MLKKLCLFLLLFYTVLGLYAAQVVILNTTDLHGRANSSYGGMLQIAHLIEAQKKLYPLDSMLLIDCGDTIQGTFSSMIFKGALMVKCLNYLKYDVWVVGNHEFDYPLKTVKKRMQEFSGAVLAANLRNPELAKLHSSWKMFTRDGIKIAVIGLTKSGMSKTIPFDAALARIMPEIKAKKPNVIILAQHEGMYTRGFSIYKFAAKYPEIDLVLGGHTHVKVAGQKIGSGTWYFQAGKHAAGLGKIVIDYDGKVNKIKKISSEIIPVEKNTPVDKKLLAEIKPDLERVKKLEEQEITTMIFRNTEKLDSSVPEQKVIGYVMLKQTGADVAVRNSYPTKYKLSGAVKITLKRLYYWCRYNNTACSLTLDKPTYQKIIEEQKKWEKKDYRTIITYANKNLFKKKDKITAVFSSYAVSGGGGRFPFLRQAAQDPKYMLKDDNIIIRDSLESYLKGKELIVDNRNGEITISQK